jgi:hypothetical protein
MTLKEFVSAVYGLVVAQQWVALTRFFDTVSSILSAPPVIVTPDGLAEVKDQLAKLTDLVTKQTETIMAIRPEIQALVDTVAPLSDAVVRLEAKITAGGSLSAEEVTALSDAANAVNNLTSGIIAALAAAAGG